MNIEDFRVTKLKNLSDYTASHRRRKTTSTVRTAINKNTTKKYYSRGNLCCKVVWSKLNVTNCEVREKTNKMQQLGVYYQYFINMFRTSLCPSSGEQDVCYCMWCAALVLLDVVGIGCGALRCRVRAL